MTQVVTVLGAGTMGSGIAQVAAASGWEVWLLDVDAAVVEKAIAGVARNLDRLVEKGKLTAQQRQQVTARIHAADGEHAARSSTLIVEAIIENLEVKSRTLAPLVATAGSGTIFATNTSSLSVTKLGRAIGAGARTVGMHFFNPVPLMPLVEVISGEDTVREAANSVAEIAASWGKTVVRAKDTPGFIVNRVARGYYLESLRILGEGIAGVDEIDATMKRLGGFRMGPFELMDLIGIDVNYGVTLSVWEQMGRPTRLAPHPIQQHLFETRQFGRKTKRGFYSHEQEPPLSAVTVERRSFELPPRLYAAVRRFADGATTVGGSSTEQYVFARVLATIINEAALALDDLVATAADIDTAMTLGTNYPSGPIEWAEKIGRHTVRALLDELNVVASDRRFTPAKWFL